MFTIIIIAMLFAFVRGIKEGMVFDRYYVQGHRFFKVYHLINVIKYSLYAVLVLLIYCEFDVSVLFAFRLVLILMVLWEYTELGYSFSKYGVLIPDTELIVFVDLLRFEMLGKEVKIIHGFRMLVIVALFIFVR